MLRKKLQGSLISIFKEKKLVLHIFVKVNPLPSSGGT